MEGNWLADKVSDRVLMEMKMRLERSILLLNQLQVLLMALGLPCRKYPDLSNWRTPHPQTFEICTFKVIAVLDDI